MLKSLFISQTRGESWRTDVEYVPNSDFTSDRIPVATDTPSGKTTWKTDDSYNTASMESGYTREGLLAYIVRSPNAGVIWSISTDRPRKSTNDGALQTT